MSEKLSLEDIKKLYSTLTEVHGKIINKHFEPTPSKTACKYCGFKKHCPSYQGDEINE